MQEVTKPKGKPRSDLEEVLMKFAPTKDVMIAISNYNLVPYGELPMWLKGVKHAGVTNYLVVAIDDKLNQWCIQNNEQCFYSPVVIPKHHENTGDNHAVSAMKFGIILEFLKLGWNVLLCDVDVLVLQDPFKHLYKDHDVEGMSDGFDEPTAYGHIDGIDDQTMGWSRYAQATRHMALNSGLFYIRATEPSKLLMHRIADRLSREKEWDQSMYNMEMFFLSHGDYKSPGVIVRVLDIYKFMNSKVLFKTVRYWPQDRQPLPVMVHMNYHPDKLNRMQHAWRYYVDGDKHALDDLPGGSEPGT